MSVITPKGGNVMPGPKWVYTDFQAPFVTSKKLGGAATGSAGDENLILVGGHGNVLATGLEYHILGTQTILAPAQAALGIDINMDRTANDGIELTNGILYGANQPHTFKVGTDGAFYFRVKFSCADVSGSDDCAVGFRKCEDYQANIDDYDEMACLNVISGDIKIETILNGGDTTTTDTTQNWADGETHTLTVLVSGAGVVTYQIDGAAPTATAAFTFDSGEEVCPFFYFLNDTTTPGNVVIQEWDCGLQ